MEEDILLLDGFDDAFVGLVDKFGSPAIACYDFEKVLQVLTKDMSLDDAFEYFHYNILGSYVGDLTPCFIRYITLEELKSELNS